MKKQAGIWIDHRDAFLVFVGNGTEETERMESGVEKHVRFTGHASEEGKAEDQRDRQFAAHLAKYYDEVISHVHDAKSILIFGPGEAKGELAKRLNTKGLGALIVGVEAADKMTDQEITAKVRQHFQKN
jgi:stalled ribosome rescue protein Dom34